MNEGARGRSRRRPERRNKDIFSFIKRIWNKVNGIVFWIVFFIILFNAIPIGLWLVKNGFKLIIWFLGLPIIGAVLLFVLILFIILAIYIWN